MHPKTPKRSLAALALAAALALSPETARAREDGLPLQEALAKALQHNKELGAFLHRLDEEAGRLRQAGLLPNPELKIEIEDATGTSSYSGFDRAQSTLSLEWVIEGWIRRRRVGAAQARSEQVGLEAQLLRLDIAAETAQHFLRCLANQARLERAEEAVSLAEDTADAVKRRVRAGKAPTAELARAEAELALANLERGDVSHELASAYHRLAAQWGEIEPGFTRVDGELLTLPKTESFEGLAARVERNPQVALLVSEERVASARVRLAEAKRWPTFRPRAGLRHYAASDDIGLVVELAFDLPVFDRNQGEVARTRAALARTRADAEAARVRVHTTLFSMYQELQHHFHRADTLRDQVVPLLTKALEETRLGYERGRYSYFEWRTVKEDLLDAKSELVEASTGAHLLVISLQQLTGERVTQP